MPEERMFTSDEHTRLFVEDGRKLTLNELSEWEIYELENIEIVSIPCKICGYTSINANVSAIERHHIDNDHKNNNPSNIIELCGSCHNELTNLLRIRLRKASNKERLRICNETIQQLRNQKIIQNKMWIKK